MPKKALKKPKIAATISYCVVAGVLAYLVSDVIDHARWVSIFVFFGPASVLTVVDNLSGTSYFDHAHKWWGGQSTSFHIAAVAISLLALTNFPTAKDYYAKLFRKPT